MFNRTPLVVGAIQGRCTSSEKVRNPSTIMGQLDLYLSSGYYRNAVRILDCSSMTYLLPMMLSFLRHRTCRFQSLSLIKLYCCQFCSSGHRNSAFIVVPQSVDTRRDQNMRMRIIAFTAILEHLQSLENF